MFPVLWDPSSANACITKDLGFSSQLKDKIVCLLVGALSPVNEGQDTLSSLPENKEEGGKGGRVLNEIGP